MKKLSIYEVYVVMESQEQCDRIKQLCIDNGLPIDEQSNFKFDYKGDYFEYYEGEFFVFYQGTEDECKTKITEQEFIELLKITEK